MKCKDIITRIEEVYPPRYAAEWDNVGLLIGDEDKEIKTVYAALDVTDETLAEAVEDGADMIITHHPMLFRPVSKITRQDFIGRRILAIAEHGIAYYAMHTNYDVRGMADRNAADLGILNPKVLETTVFDDDGTEQGFGRIGGLAEPLSLSDFAAKVKEVFALSAVRVYGDPLKTIRCAAVSSGAGRGSIQDAIVKGADVLVTGDVDYHTGIDAKMRGIAVIDAGHYGTEFSFIEEITAFLKAEFPDLDVRRADVCQPYAIM